MYPANEKSPKGKVTTEKAAAVQWGLVVLLSGFAWFTNQNNAYLSYTGPWCSRCAWQESDIDSHWHHAAQKRKKSFQSSLRSEVLARGDFLLMHWTHYLNLWLCLVSATISVTVWRAKQVPFNGFTPQKKKQTCVSVMKRFKFVLTPKAWFKFLLQNEMRGLWRVTKHCRGCVRGPIQGCPEINEAQRQQRLVVKKTHKPHVSVHPGSFPLWALRTRHLSYFHHYILGKHELQLLSDSFRNNSK